MKRACRVCGAFIVPSDVLGWKHERPQPVDEPMHRACPL